MAGIGVSEGRSNFIFSLKSALNQLGISKVGIKAAKEKDAFDAVLVGNPPPRQNMQFSSKLLIVPDCVDTQAVSPEISESIISYGLRRHNSVTASSLIGERLVVALQRDIPTIDGKLVEEQEFSVKVSRGEQSDKVLGIVTTLIALGVPVEDISKISFDF